MIHLSLFFIFLINFSCLIESNQINSNQTIRKFNTTKSTIATKWNFRKNSTLSTTKSQCTFRCKIYCEFGYKRDVLTKCYKCQCADLTMSECGVPCYPNGTDSCLYAQRANSRPQCVCSKYFEGTYCEKLTKNFTYPIKVNKSISAINSMANSISNNIKMQLVHKIYNLVEIGPEQIFISNIKNNSNQTNFEFDLTIRPPDYCALTCFTDIIDKLFNQIKDQKVTIRLLDEDLILKLKYL